MSRKNFILAVILMTVVSVPGVMFGADTTPPALPVTNCISVGDDLKLNIFAQYSGSQYGFELNYTPVSADPSGFYWKADISTFSPIQREPSACISVSDDLRLNVCVQHHGTNFEFSLDYTPVSEDASGFYWKADIGTLKQK